MGGNVWAGNVGLSAGGGRKDWVGVAALGTNALPYSLCFWANGESEGVCRATSRVPAWGQRCSLT